MHQLQKILLKRLVVQNNQRYSYLTSGYDFEDNIVFHLNKLIENKLVEKNNGIYSITLNGIKEISRFEPVELEDRGVKTFFIGFLCKSQEKNRGEVEYLIKSHPNAKANFYNLPSGKPYFGENIEDALQRTFLDNTGLKLDADRFKFLSLHLKTIKNEEEEIVFDDAFTIYEVEVTEEEKDNVTLADAVNWVRKDEIKRLENKWPEIDICIIDNNRSPYLSYIHNSNYIL